MESLEQSLSILCEKLPFEITIYEEKGRCEIKRKACGYCNPSEKEYLCTKKNQIHLRQPILQFF